MGFANNIPANNQPERDVLRYQLNSWLCIQILLPVFFIAILWPVYKFLFLTPFAFERVFSSADLIPFSSLILLGVFLDIDSEEKLNNMQKKSLQYYRLAALIFAIIILSLFGFLKYHNMSYQFPSQAQATVDDVITVIAFISISCLFFSVCLAYLAKLTLIMHKCANSGTTPNNTPVTPPDNTPVTPPDNTPVTQGD